MPDNRPQYETTTTRSTHGNSVVLTRAVPKGAQAFRFIALLAVAYFAVHGAWQASADPSPIRQLVDAAESARIRMIDRVAPAVVCIYDAQQKGGGSGVLIDAEGHGITNFHVIAGMLAERRGFGGLSDGKLYDLTVLGFDPTGDIAMFRLQGDAPFSFANLGDSDAVRVGDPAIAMGNPFVLSEDYTPTVTLGIVTGVRRYQWGEGSKLVYSDCIQTDTPINPGNSGGPLFNAAGDIIGINGRISVSTRGRFNVGHGYAITSNQVARFIPSLRAGLFVKHGTLQATVAEDDRSGVTVNMVKPKACADLAGVRSGDRLLAVDGVAIRTPNEFASVLGAYPADWPLKLALERDGQPLELTVTLDDVPVETKQKLSADPQVNREAIRHLLNRFQRAVGLPDGKRPREWTWQLKRTIGEQPDADDVEVYAASLTTGQPIMMTRQYADGAVGKQIKFDDATAAQSVDESAQWYDLPAETAAVLHVYHTLLNTFTAPVDELDLEPWSHVGGEPLPDEAMRLVDSDRLRKRGRLPFMLEVLERKYADQRTARFAFDPETGRLLRVVIRDAQVDAITTITFSDYRSAAELTWPCRASVTGRGGPYTDLFTQWGSVR